MRSSISARFKAALKRAEENVTEKGESAALKVIAASSPAAFAGNLAARLQMVSAIVRLGNINREAMNQADKRVRQFGEAGIWGVVFMAIACLWRWSAFYPQPIATGGDADGGAPCRHYRLS